MHTADNCVQVFDSAIATGIVMRNIIAIRLRQIIRENNRCPLALENNLSIIYVHLPGIIAL